MIIDEDDFLGTASASAIQPALFLSQCGSDRITFVTSEQTGANHMTPRRSRVHMTKLRFPKIQSLLSRSHLHWLG